MVGTNNLNVEISANDHIAFAAGQGMSDSAQVLTAASPALEDTPTMQSDPQVLTAQVSEALSSVSQPQMSSISPTRKMLIKPETSMNWLDQEFKELEHVKPKSETTLILCPWCSIPYANPNYLERHKKQCRKRLETVTLEEAQSQMQVLTQADTHTNAEGQATELVHVTQAQAAQVQAVQVQAAQFQAVQLLQGGQVQVAHVNGQPVMLSVDKVGHVCGLGRGTCQRCSPSKVLRSAITPTITVEELPIDIACSGLFSQDRDVTESLLLVERPYCITVNNKTYIAADAKPVRDHTSKQFACSDCGESFSKNSALVEHSKVHTGEKPYGCIECGMRFSCSSNLKEHCRLHAGEKPFGCTDCGVWFSRSEHLKEHLESHSGGKDYDDCGERRDIFLRAIVKDSSSPVPPVTPSRERPFSCGECGERFTQNSDLKRHSGIHSGDKHFACSECGQRFTRSSHLKEHTRIHTGEKPYGCTDCGERFTRSKSLRRHSLAHSGEKPFPCNFCKERFTQNSDLKRHLLIHTGEKPFICSECGERYTRSSGLKEHFRIHTGERPFTCSDCGTRFTHNSDLKRHTRIHSGVKPFCCNSCGERFTQNSDLKRHIRIHTGEKPYGCSECGERFTRSSGLKEHFRIHTGEKPFMCNECGQRFIKKRDLKRHTRVHTGEKPYCCSQCPQTFTQNSDLKRHAKVHQPDKIVSYSEGEERFF